MYNNENYGNGFGPTEEKKEQNIPNVDAEGGEVKAESGAAYTEGSTGFSENTESASYNKQENRENTAGGAYGTYGQWSGRQYGNFAQNPNADASMWSDPECTAPLDNQAGNVYSPNYHRPEVATFASNHEKPKREKKKMSGGTKSFLRAVCLVIVCALISSVSAVMVTDYKLDNVREKNQVVLGSNNSGSTNASGAGDVKVPSGEEMSAEDIYNLACQQTVGVQTSATSLNIFGQSTTTPAVSGSGFIISADGYILTNYHVIEYAAVYGESNGYELSVIMHDGTSYPAEIVGYEEDNDVAVLKIDATGLNAVTLGDSSSMNVGERVYAVGNPLGELDYTMTEGIISALDRVISTEASTAMNVFQISAAVNSGNSGGPVYNSRGEVIGIVTAKTNQNNVEGIGFAIPIDDAINISTSLIQYGYVTGKPYMGVSIQVVPSSVSLYYDMPAGALVGSVEEDGPAAAAGIQAGDVITKIGDEEITDYENLKATLSAYSAGDTVPITVDRDGETIELTITFAEAPHDSNTNAESNSVR